jgi:hypothetical protein
MVNRGYRGSVIVLVTEEEGEYDGLGSCEGVAGHDEQARGKVLQQDRGVVELDFGGQGCDARLRGSGIILG